MSLYESLDLNTTYHDSLNPVLFDEGDLKLEIQKRLLEIADLFLDYLQVDIRVIDIRLVGSNASFNYHEGSDVDVHIITDLSQISDPEMIARLYFDSAKKNFKDTYDISIKGMDVELYVEDVNTSSISKGIYSLLKSKWIRYPENTENPSPENIKAAENLEANVLSRIDNAMTLDELQTIEDDIYIMRKDALSDGGENAPGNLAFKSLRNKGILDILKDTIHTDISKELTIESKDAI